MTAPYVITAAIVGAETTREQTPHLPISAQELGEEAAKCREAGAAMVHLHVRNPDGTETTYQFGTTGDQPVPADYFGYGRVQVAVYRPSTQQWFIRDDSGGTTPVQWGGPDDVPVPADLEKLDPQLRDYLRLQLKWVQQKPVDPTRQATLGIVYAANLLWAEARRCFSNVTRINPKEPL